MPKLTSPQRKWLLETMFRAREGDRREGILARQGKGWFQITGLGHEALATLSLLMNKDDYLFPHYRDRALILARGLANKDIARGFLAKRTSTSGGRQLPGHYSHRELKIWSMPSPTGGNLLPACGVAWGMKLNGQDNVVWACVGDAGMRQGEFYEALAFAHQKQLPIVFVIEDNQFGISTRTTSTNPLRLGLFNEKHVIRVDGRDAVAVHQAASECLRRVRSSDHPCILWCEVDRLASHSSSDDHRIYRSPEDIEEMNSRDPIERLAAWMIENNELQPDGWESLKESIVAEIERDYREVDTEPDPRPDEVLDQLFGPAPEEDIHLHESESTDRMLDAVNRTFRDHLERDRRVLFFGEDIEDPMGGVFKLTNGLSTDFPDRVFNSPLAEATILGVGCGLAAYGMKPVFELQFIDFVGPAWNQLVNNIATLRWRTHGDWICPMVVYAPYGAYLPGGGPWHSQSNEAAFAHVPGLRVVVPSTPEDAAGLVHTAIKAQDPTIVLLPKHLLRARVPATRDVVSIPFGKARIRKRGDDITILCWGNCTEIVEHAVGELDGHIRPEIIDLRSIVPWDRDTICESVLKTGRLLVVEEDNRTCSFGQNLISELVQEPGVWDCLVAPPVLLSRSDVHIGFHPIYELTSLPSAGEVAEAVRRLTGQETIADTGGKNRTAPGHHAGHLPPQNTTTMKKVPIRIPAIGEGLEEARILKFFKKPGDPVKQDEVIYQLETDKAVVDIESPLAGVIQSWDAPPDSTVRIGAVVGHIESDADAPEDHEADSGPSLTNPAVTSAPTATTTTGPRSGKDDADLEFQETPLSEQQQILAARLTRAARVAVPATIFQLADWENIKAARETFRNDPANSAITTFTIAAWCVTRALEKHVQFRSSLPRNNILRVYKNVNLGLAVSLPGDDLTTAVIERAEELCLRDFAARLRERVDLARQGIDQARQQVSLIITSMTSFDIPHGVPVIVPPAVGTLLISSPHRRVDLDEQNRPVARDTVNLSLTIDHRVINGAGAAAFLNEVKAEMENFTPANVKL